MHRDIIDVPEIRKNCNIILKIQNEKNRNFALLK